MSGLLYTLLGLAASSSLHCAVRREINPCTCRQEEFGGPIIINPVTVIPSSDPLNVSGSISGVVTNSNTEIPGEGGGGGGGGGIGGVSVSSSGNSGIVSGGSGGGVVNNYNSHGHGERIEVVCEKMESFGQLADALRGKFTAEQQITLRVTHSQLRDISRHDFKDLRMSITRLELNHDQLGYVVHFFFSFTLLLDILFLKKKKYQLFVLVFL